MSTDAWHAEWIKARTVAATGWLLAATVVLGAGLSAAVCAVVAHYRSDADDAAAVVDAIGAAGSRAIAASAELLDRAAEPTRFSAPRRRETDARRLLPGYKTAGWASVPE